MTVPEALRDLARQAWELLLEQLTPPLLSITSPLYWTHLVAALLLAWLVFRVGDGPGDRSLRAFQRRHLTLGIYWHRSARVDYALYFLNGVVFPLLVAPHLLADVVLRDGVVEELSSLFGPAQGGAVDQGSWWAVLLTAAVFVAYDFGRWLGHWLMHRVPGLWVFHKVHHSAEVLTPMTNFRAHPVELAVMVATTTLTTGVCAGALLYLCPAGPVWETLSLGAAVALFAFDLGGALLRHSSVWLSYGPFGRILVSPAQHQIHHSVAPAHLGKNLGFALAIWDALAGTLYLPRQRERITVGLGDGGEPAYRSIVGVYLMPFVELSRLALRAMARLGRPLPFVVSAAGSWGHTGLARKSGAAGRSSCHGRPDRRSRNR